jgi:hypothetical protein
MLITRIVRFWRGGGHTALCADSAAWRGEEESDCSQAVRKYMNCSTLSEICFLQGFGGET